MLRWILIALALLAALRLLARLAPTPSAAPRERDAAPPPNAAPRPRLSAAERAELEAERERALREGRQIDAIEIHRRLTGR